MSSVAVLAFVACGLVGLLPAAKAAPPAGDAPAVAETEPVLSAGDAADDMAIWVDPSDPSRSLVIGTDKLAALEVYDLSGARIQRITADGAPNNVDLRPGFSLAGASVGVVATTGGGFLRFYTVDPATRQLTNASARVIQPDIQAEGICMYQSASTGSTYAFVAAPSGQMEQWELFENAGKVDARLVRGPWDVSAAPGSRSRAAWPTTSWVPSTSASSTWPSGSTAPSRTTRPRPPRQSTGRPPTAISPPTPKASPSCASPAGPGT